MDRDLKIYIYISVSQLENEIRSKLSSKKIATTDGK